MLSSTGTNRPPTRAHARQYPRRIEQAEYDREDPGLQIEADRRTGDAYERWLDQIGGSR